MQVAFAIDNTYGVICPGGELEGNAFAGKRRPYSSISLSKSRSSANRISHSRGFGAAGDRRPYGPHCKTWHESGAGLSPRGWRPGFLESKLLPYGKKPPGYARKMTIAGVPTSVYRPANVRAPFWRFTRNAAMASAL